jgi:universal stress protein E
MPTLNKVFAVIDPTMDTQAALVSATKIAARSEASTLHVYEAVDATGINGDADGALARHRAFVESLVEPLRAGGANVSVEIELTKDWRTAIAAAAERAEADLIVKTAGEHSRAGRRLLKTSDWTLLRHAHCPVYLVKKDSIQSGAKILVALNIAHPDELHSKLNAQVLEYGRDFVKAIPYSSLHAVNAYANSDEFIYPSDLAETTGIQKIDAHTVEDASEKAIPGIAEQIGADIVIIGTAARNGLKAAVIGNTAEKILDALSTNILTVNLA